MLRIDDIHAFAVIKNVGVQIHRLKSENIFFVRPFTKKSYLFDTTFFIHYGVMAYHHATCLRAYHHALACKKTP